MNILIVGNGFDLSHYLPTKYDHFMDMMRAIEESKNETMNFDELFSECREGWFIAKTKQYYLTENIILEKEQLEKIRDLLKENCWYKFFKQHVRDIKTWIDFEQKINEALIAISIFIDKISRKIDEIGYYSHNIIYYGECQKDQIFIRYEYCKNLESLNLLKSGYYEDISDTDGFGREIIRSEETYDESDDHRFYIKDEINSYKNGYQKIDENIILENLQKSLEAFIDVFNLYLTLVVDKLNPKFNFKIDEQSWVKLDHIYSFNYTKSFLRFYKSIKTDFLHGQLGKNQNIVLGISDIDNESLKKLKAYGFTKYHQKLFKDTDYLFLDSYKNLKTTNYINNNNEQNLKGIERKVSQHLNLKFFIWGHSLDVSDQDYILDLFSLNDDMDRNVRVIVFYFDRPAKFSLLNNLLAILGKDKVEQWMKNKWLTFEPNPEIDFGIQEESDLEKQAS